MNKPQIHIDFETRSTVDLRLTGAHRYAQHPTTGVWCLAYAIDDSEVGLWAPGDPWPKLDMGADFYAHNASFELTVWNEIMNKRYGWPALFPKQTRCTMAMSYAMALPGSLDQSSQAVKLNVRKDMAGNRLMKRMARPRNTTFHNGFAEVPATARLRETLENGNELYETVDGVLIAEIEWWNTPDRVEKLHAYCRNDVVVERMLHTRLRELIEVEQEVWELDQAINNRGIPVDVQEINNAIAFVAEAKRQLDAEMKKITGGWVSGVTKVEELTEWLDLQGVDTKGVAKAEVHELLERKDLPPHVRQALELRRDGAKSSVAKLQAIQKSVSADGRVRGAFQYHAATTGRWGGRKVQTQNIPRPTLKQPEIDEVIAMIGELHEA